MKKVGIVLLVVCVLMSILTFSIFGFDNNNKTEETSYEQVNNETSQDNEDINTVNYLQKNTVLKEHNMDFKEFEENAVSIIDKQSAIEKAKEIVGSQIVNESEKFSAVLTRYTRNDMKKLPDSDIVLDNYPTWVVTFYGVNIEKQGPKLSGNKNKSVYADINVFLDANNGKEISVISHTSSLSKK
ncbi:MAG TPA: hypothetical protein VIK72_15915 [Clostridiaceae bacterium]